MKPANSVLPKAPPTLTGAHGMAWQLDCQAVDEFATAMKEKLAVAREKGRGGWQDCAPSVLSRMLREHVEKGDPRDVANFCMFLWHHGVSIGAKPPGAAIHAQPGQALVGVMPSLPKADLRAAPVGQERWPFPKADYYAAETVLAYAQSCMEEWRDAYWNLRRYVERLGIDTTAYVMAAASNGPAPDSHSWCGLSTCKQCSPEQPT